MRGDNVITASSATASKSATTIIEDVAERAGAPSLAGDKGHSLKKRLDICGAMAQQRSDSGSGSTPQKFVRLVGCRDRGIKPLAKR